MNLVKSEYLGFISIFSFILKIHITLIQKIDHIFFGHSFSRICFICALALSSYLSFFFAVAIRVSSMSFLSSAESLGSSPLNFLVSSFLMFIFFYPCVDVFTHGVV